MKIVLKTKRHFSEAQRSSEKPCFHSFGYCPNRPQGDRPLMTPKEHGNRYLHLGYFKVQHFTLSHHHHRSKILQKQLLWLLVCPEAMVSSRGHGGPLTKVTQLINYNQRRSEPVWQLPDIIKSPPAFHSLSASASQEAEALCECDFDYLLCKDETGHCHIASPAKSRRKNSYFSYD